MSGRPVLTLGLLVSLFASVAMAQSLRSGEVVSTITARTLATPDPVLGADNRIHLAYELLISNPSNLFITLDKVEAVDGVGKSLGGLSGPGLKAMTRLYAGKDLTLAPGGMGFVFMDISFVAGAVIPTTIATRLSLTRQSQGPDGKPAPMAPDSPFAGQATFTGAGTAVSRARAVVIDPPLRGDHWVAVNGCCDDLTSHRGAVIPVNGVPHVSERFAIDWVRLDTTNRL
jgi:hypothetical protein